jgi:hypothetical protein
MKVAQFTIRPDMKTSGGEVCDICLDGGYIGTIVLVIREGHRVAGSVQLEQESLTRSERKEALQFIQSYVEQTVAAVGAEDCEVVVTCSPYDVIIASEDQIGMIEEFVEMDDEGELLFDDEEDDDEYDEYDEYVIGDGEDEETSYSLVDSEESEASEQMLRDPTYYELVIVGESRNRVEYHVYDRDDEWIAEVYLRIRGADVSGEINWIYEPLENEIEHVAELIVADLNDSEVDTIQLDMLYEGEIIESLELTHEDMLDEEDLELDDEEEEEWTYSARSNRQEYEVSDSDEHSRYSFVLARDDGDALTYEIFEKSHGSYPIGTATVDISLSKLTGFIEFRDFASSTDREQIGALLLHELDKERDYESVHFTMLLNNRPIDEITYETDQLH